MGLTDDDSKILTSALVGIAGFLASHVFTKMSKKDDQQDGLSADLRVLQAQVERLESDIKELKHALSSVSKENRVDMKIVGERLHIMFSKLIELAGLAERAGWNISEDWELPKRRRRDEHDDEP
jgi:uncharacterized protein YlxW (UPF0749 family)